MDQSGSQRPKVDSERMERGLEAAYGGDGESVLDALERLNGVKSRVHLVDTAGEDTPVLRVPASDDDEIIADDSRYQVLGEIARGGVGIILKSRDRDLGRDVALKVLKKDLASVPEVVQRFVEEAQIEGQLQHPGVVPVYGIGVQKDGRPYFAMKLVKGETLSALIRSGGKSSRSKHVSAFEKICQTVAYAHARRVIHRDLKPANILVGAFGEVQVVDWGFAKVLQRGGVADEHRERRKKKPEFSVIETIRSGSGGSESRVGSIMGTPAYMPPEQAQGDTEAIDERADVFSLGAMLTEILTGRPPYTGKVPDQIRAAAKAKLRPAYDRLDKSGADPQLIELAKSCLTPAPEGRPRHAGEVAQRVTSYLASQEIRRRKAELRAAAEKRTRKLSIALAASILLVVMLGGGGWTMMENARRGRIEAAHAAVDGALKEVGVLFGNAQSTDVEKLEVWPPVVAKAEDAERLAWNLGAADAKRKETVEFTARVKAAQTEARKLAKIVADDRELSDQLWEVRLSRHEHITPIDANRNYGPYFRVRDVDVEANKPERVAAWIRERTIRSEIMAVLDDWAYRIRKEDKSPSRITTVLGVLDPDELRNRIREAVGLEDATKLYLVRKGLDPEKVPADTLLLLAESFGNLGEAGTAVDLYRVLGEREEDSFRALSGLGYWLMMRAPARYEEAADVLAKAAKLRDSSIAVRQLWSRAHWACGEVDQALVVMREIHERVPKFEPVKDELAGILAHKAKIFQQAKNFGLAAAVMKEAAEVRPLNTETLTTYGLVLVQCRNTIDAEKVGKKLVEYDKNHWAGHFVLAEACRLRGKTAESLKHYREAEVLSPRSTWVLSSKGMALARTGQLEKAIECWEMAEKLRPGLSNFWNQIGTAYERLGDRRAAIEAFERARAASPAEPSPLANLAYVSDHAGDLEAARKYQEQAAYAQSRKMWGVGTLVRGSDHHAFGYYLGRYTGEREAIEHWEKCFPTATDFARAHFLTGFAATRLRYHGDFGDAIRLVEKALLLAPGDWNIHQWRASLALIEDDRLRALHHAWEATKLAKGGSALLTFLSALQVNGRHEDACRLLERLAQDAPVFREQFEIQTRALRLHARLEDILSGALKPKDAMDFAALGNVLSTAGYYSRAWSFWERYWAGREPEEDPMMELQVTQGNSLGAAGTALQLAAGKDREAGEPREQDRIRWMEEALDKLEKYMTCVESERRFLDGGITGSPFGVNRVTTLKLHPIYGPIRDPGRISQLPEELQARCKKLWADVDRFWKSVR